MSKFLDEVIAKAKSDIQTIVLPEGDDPRVVEAGVKAAKDGLAKIVILGSQETVAAHGFDLGDVQIIDPANSPQHDEFAAKLQELRAKKGMTIEQASEQIKDVLYYGVMMVYLGYADGMVSGACHATGDVLRPALQILKTAPGTKLVSSFFVISVPDCELGNHGTFVFADCALNQYPNADELSEIAIASAESYKNFIGGEPVVAMMCHSSYGSAKGASIDKVQEATKLAQEKRPDLLIDGDLQADASMVPSVGASKAPGSKVAGKANVLVFPDIDAGNIGYKLVQRLGKAEAYGPVTQGIAKPVNDLSRGCSADDVYGVIAITSIQAQAHKAQQ